MLAFSFVALRPQLFCEVPSNKRSCKALQALSAKLDDFLTLQCRHLAN